MNNASVMGGLRRVSELTWKPEHLVERQPTPAACIAVSSNPIGECFTIDQLHDESRCGSRLFDPEKRGDVGMNERREDERFLLEAGKALRIERVSVWENLQGDIAAQSGVAGAIDFAHSASAQQFDDFEGP